MRRDELARVLDHDQALRRRHAAEQGAEQGRLASAGAAADHDREPSGDDRAQQSCHRALDEIGEFETAPRKHPQRQRGVPSDRRQNRVQARAVRKDRVYKRRRIVKSPASRGGQSLGKPTHGDIVGEADRRTLESATAIEPDLVGPIDEHVGDARQPEERLERSGARKLSQHIALESSQCRVVGDHLGAGLFVTHDADKIA